MTSPAPARFLAVIGLVLASVAVGHAFDEAGDDWIRGTYTGRSPRAVRLTAAEAWQRATQTAAELPGAFVLAGTGHSMRPLYPAGTVLVLRDTPFDELRPGQTAVYRNSDGRAVGHVLIAKARDGWRVKGLNNRMHDMEPVHRDNLVGVVVAAYLPTDAGSRRSARRPAATAVFQSD